MNFKLTDIPIKSLQRLGLSLDSLMQDDNLTLLLEGKKTKSIQVQIPSFQEIRRVVLYLERLEDAHKTVFLKVITLNYPRATPEQIAASPIPYKQLSPYGLNKASLEASGVLAKILSGEESDVLTIPIFLMGSYQDTAVRISLVIKAGHLHFDINLV
jgi:hypothetical protein